MSNPNDDFFQPLSPDEEPLRVESQVEEDIALNLKLSVPEKPKRETPPIATPNKSSHRAFCGCLAIFAVVPLICCGFFITCGGVVLALIAVSESNEVLRTETYTLEVRDEDNITLEVNNLVGETSIRGANVEEITVEVDLRASGLSKSQAEEKLDQTQVDVHREGDRYLITVDYPDTDDDPFISRSVDLRITVPEKLSIEANTNVGALTVRDVEITGHLNLVNNIGDITFSGTLEAEGQHTITNNIGAIYVTVSNDSRFSLDATSDVGDVRATIDLDQLSDRQSGIGAQVTGIYGGDDEPPAQLILVSNIGEIQISD